MHHLLTSFRVIIQLGINVRRKLLEHTLVRRKIGAFSLLMPYNHPLPRHLKRSPAYSSNLPRLATHLLKKYANLSLIDIGANVGDTVALVRSATHIPIICIEGDAAYYELLAKNIAQFDGVSAYQQFLDESDSLRTVTVEKKEGTLRLTHGTMPLSAITLDTFIKSHSNAENAKLLKIDTDGYDCKILRGARSYLARAHPVLFFEMDRYLLSETGDDARVSFQMIRSLGYEHIIFYDNAGRLLLSTKLSETVLLDHLYRYTYHKEGAFPYYDVCVFHSEDTDVFETFLSNEIARVAVV